MGVVQGIKCTGTLIAGTACNRCSKCMNEARDIVLGFKDQPLGLIEGHEMIILSTALSVLVKNLGTRVLLDQWSTWVRGTQ